MKKIPHQFMHYGTERENKKWWLENDEKESKIIYGTNTTWRLKC